MTETAKPSRRGTLVILICAAAAFGPYVASGIRTEQVAVYGTLALLLTSAAWMRIRPSQSGIAVGALWTVLAVITAIGAVQPALNGTRYPYGSVFAGMDNYLLPLVVMASMWMVLAAGADRDRLLRIACLVTVWAMACNSVLAIMSFAGDAPDLEMFYNGDNAPSVSYLASTMGRFSGAINQPAEAGLLYSVALLAAIYLYRQRALLLAISATMLTIGGILTVSKIFLIVGAPVGLWQVLTATGGRQRRITCLAGMALLVVGILRSGLAPAWAGQDFLLRLLPSSGQDAVTLYSAGRFGDSSTLAGVADAVLRASPVWGFGAPGLQVPYDNGWVEALVVAGVVGAATYTAVLVALVVAWWRLRGRLGVPQWRLAGGIVFVVVGASGGVPALTANRCATILWILLTLLLLSRPERSAGEPVGAVGVDGGPRVGAVQHQ